MKNEENVVIYFDTDTPRTTNPGECYARISKIFSDKERTDYDIKSLVAKYFIFKPELVNKDCDENSLMAGIQMSHIGAYRNGDTEFSFFYSSNIYARDKG